MKFELNKDCLTYKLTMCLELGPDDMSRARLNHWDNVLITSCEKSDKVSDKLLALETLVRRVEEGVLREDTERNAARVRCNAPAEYKGISGGDGLPGNNVIAFPRRQP